MDDHLSPELARAHALDALTAPEAADVAAHIAVCADCAAQVTAEQAGRAAVASALRAYADRARPTRASAWAAVAPRIVPGPRRRPLAARLAASGVTGVALVLLASAGVAVGAAGLAQLPPVQTRVRAVISRIQTAVPRPVAPPTATMPPVPHTAAAPVTATASPTASATPGTATTGGALDRDRDRDDAATMDRDAGAAPPAGVAGTETMADATPTPAATRGFARRTPGPGTAKPPRPTERPGPGQPGRGIGPRPTTDPSAEPPGRGHGQGPRPTAEETTEPPGRGHGDRPSPGAPNPTERPPDRTPGPPGHGKPGRSGATPGHPTPDQPGGRRHETEEPGQPTKTPRS